MGLGEGWEAASCRFLALNEPAVRRGAALGGHVQTNPSPTPAGNPRLQVRWDAKSEKGSPLSRRPRSRVGRCLPLSHQVAPRECSPTSSPHPSFQGWNVLLGLVSVCWAWSFPSGKGSSEKVNRVGLAWEEMSRPRGQAGASMALLASDQGHSLQVCFKDMNLGSVHLVCLGR